MARKSKSDSQAGNNGDLSAQDASSPFALRREHTETPRHEGVHVLHGGFRCDTENAGRATPHGHPPAELVLDATEGFIPLWAKHTTLRWRFRDSSFQRFAKPATAKAAVQAIFAKAVLAWGDAAPIKFAKRDDAWDFEIVMRASNDCDRSGCVLASAFFPDAGRHKLTVYPMMFDQSEEEQIETLAHEIGHVFGLRHFFALVQETGFPAVIFGKHDKFSVMNYGPESKLTKTDRSDLKKLYEQAWSGRLTAINGTPIRFVQPFHESGTSGAAVAVAVAGGG